MEETWCLSSVSSIPEPAPLLCISSSLNTTHPISANPTVCTEHSMPYTNRHEPAELVRSMSLINTHIKKGGWSLCVYVMKTGLCLFYSEPHSWYLVFSLFFFTAAYISPLSSSGHHHPMMTTARLKTSLRLRNHGNALCRQAGWWPIGFGPGLSGWDHVILALTTLPQDHFRGLAPRTLLPRPITPNHYEW